MPNTVVLVSCVKRKTAEPAPAALLYRSTWFRKAAAYAEGLTHHWLILSAEYGLVPPGRLITPYDRTLNEMSAHERRAWAKEVLASLESLLRPGDRVIVLAGMKYRENLVGPLRDLGCSVEVPMAGMRIGEQMHWLKRHLSLPHA